MLLNMKKKKSKLVAEIISLFPEACAPYFNASILGRAQKSKLLQIKLYQLRDFAHDRRRTVDDKPFGGGPGMIMKVQPFHEALVFLGLRTVKGQKTKKSKKARVILMSAKGKTFTQTEARRLAKFDRLVFLCGRYEGVDERVAKKLADEEMSIGQYVLTGGELAAMVMIDVVARLGPGVLGKEASLVEESWSQGRTKEYPQYTRPENYLGSKVPDVLLSGNHQKIAAWRKEHGS